MSKAMRKRSKQSSSRRDDGNVRLFIWGRRRMRAIGPCFGGPVVEGIPSEHIGEVGIKMRPVGGVQIHQTNLCNGAHDDRTGRHKRRVKWGPYLEIGEVRLRDAERQVESRDRAMRTVSRDLLRDWRISWPNTQTNLNRQQNPIQRGIEHAVPRLLKHVPKVQNLRQRHPIQRLRERDRHEPVQLRQRRWMLRLQPVRVLRELGPVAARDLPAALDLEVVHTLSARWVTGSLEEGVENARGGVGGRSGSGGMRVAPGGGGLGKTRGRGSGMRLAIGMARSLGISATHAVGNHHDGVLSLNLRGRRVAVSTRLYCWPAHLERRHRGARTGVMPEPPVRARLGLTYETRPG
ncbi:hypothetical protein C8R46DRAFT_1117818 [Mycena filopes]|nr:hypothetical protein C8R46DRAFT_1117818 [Mycena filopes]